MKGAQIERRKIIQIFPMLTEPVDQRKN